VEVLVRESARARRWRIEVAGSGPPLVVVPRGTSRSEVERIVGLRRGWIERQLARRIPVLGLDRVGIEEADGRRLARRRVTEVVGREAPRLGVAVPRIAIRDQRTRWGSCSAGGTLSFNWRLVLAPGGVLEYVVVHELCHLREPNHSPRFWRLVEHARPTYAREREWLRRHGWELHAYVPPRVHASTRR
jgi:predicted metal-dependent hydrolase